MKLITLYWGRLVCNSSWSIKWRKNNDICHEFAFVRLQAKLQFIVLIKTSFYTLLQMIYWSNHLLMCTTNSFMCFMGKYGTLCRETCKKKTGKCNYLTGDQRPRAERRTNKGKKGRRPYMVSQKAAKQWVIILYVRYILR